MWLIYVNRLYMSNISVTFVSIKTNDMNTSEQNLRELINEVYETAVEHGWHEQDLGDNHFLMMVITEISEAVEADRKRRYANSTYYRILSEKAMERKGDADYFNVVAFRKVIKDTVEDELSDVVIRLFDLCGARGTMPKICNIEVLYGYEFTHYMFLLCRIISNMELLFAGLDIIIGRALSFIFSYCELNGIDIEWHVREKIKYNKSRTYKHGGKEY